MEKKTSLRDLSSELGVSPTTVFRALNGCGDVDARTEARIRSAAEARHYRLRQTSFSGECVCILPSVPECFWGSVRRLFREKATRRIRFFLYPFLGEKDGFLSCLASALECDPSLLIVAAPEDDSVRDALSQCGVPVFFFCEYVSMVNAFFFGSDPHADGARLGDAFRERYPGCRRLLHLMQNEGTPLSRARTESFFSRLPHAVVADRLSIPENKPYLASLLARQISEANPFDGVFCETGVLPAVCLALDKCRIPRSVICVGFEQAPSLESYRQSGRPILTLTQDLERQVSTCITSAERYLQTGTFPDAKETLIPSLLSD